MIDRLLHALARSKNEAADDVLLEALRVGNPQERQAALGALLKRQPVRGLGGVVAHYDDLPEPLQLAVLGNMRAFHHALRECGRSDQTALRLAAMRLIALGRQGKLAYVLSENLHAADEALSKAACEAMVALARWVATETRKLQSDGVGSAGSGQGGAGRTDDPHTPSSPLPTPHFAPAYSDLLDQRPEIEAAVARAMD